MDEPRAAVSAWVKRHWRTLLCAVAVIAVIYAASAHFRANQHHAGCSASDSQNGQCSTDVRLTPKQ